MQYIYFLIILVWSACIFRILFKFLDAKLFVDGWTKENICEETKSSKQRWVYQFDGKGEGERIGIAEAQALNLVPLLCLFPSLLPFKSLTS